MSEFFAMGGHGSYIWASYAIAGLILAWLVIDSVRRRRRTRDALNRMKSGRTHLRRQSTPGTGSDTSPPATAQTPSGMSQDHPVGGQPTGATVISSQHQDLRGTQG